MLDKLESVMIGGITLAKLIYIIILIVVMIIIMRVLVKVAGKAIAKSKIDTGLHRVINTVIRIALYAIFIIIIAGQLGIEISSLVALVSVAGAAIALACQNILSNIFNGTILMTTKPYKTGDYIDTGAHSGTVVDSGLFYTRIRTIDNKIIFISNTDVFSNRVVNYTAEPMRRVDHTIGVSYDAPTAQVREALLEVVKMTKGAFYEEGAYAPNVYVGEFSEFTIKYIFRVWCKTEDYWDVYFGLLENTREVFAQRGIEIPVPIQTVRIEK
ncbi:MAG: mechanosensitive ion channel family protein [Oscillospiraceae bacterium]|nr:mechanosensitive ion channel family protein [Oscillospiraceae bacterium]